MSARRPLSSVFSAPFSVRPSFDRWLRGIGVVDTVSMAEEGFFVPGGGQSPIDISFVPTAGDISWTPAWIPGETPWQPAAIESLTQSAFLWHHFTVDVTFQIGAADLGGHAHGVAVLDFVLMLHSARIALSTERVAELGLSDRQGLWCFTGHEAAVEVRYKQATSDGWRYGSEIGRCSLPEFDASVDQALASALDMIFSRQPTARLSRHLQRLASNGFAATEQDAAPAIR